MVGRLLLFAVIAVVCGDETKDFLILRQLSTGWIKGRLVNTDRGVKGFAYTAIPYAEPPIDDKRFRKPEQKLPWNGTLDATRYGNSCMWNASITDLIDEYKIMSEDCLQANVFTNRHCLTQGNCSVMIYIHGGGFLFDSPMLLEEEFIITNFGATDRNVVVVTIAYRLGILGFSNFAPYLNDSSAPKNLGVQDMLEALRWVQREIHVFGGNPNHVTVMGHSTGSVAADHLAHSEVSEGLFHQVIIMSGSGRNQYLTLNQNTNTSHSLAVGLGCATWETDFNLTQKVNEVMDCLRRLPAKEILNQQRALEDQGIMLFGPARDSEIFPASMDTLAKTKRPIPTMVGTVTYELQETNYLIKHDGTVDVDFLEWYCNKTIYNFNYRNKVKTVQDCVQEYNDLNKVTFLYDDYTYFVPSYLNAKESAKVGAPAYLYEFTYPNVRDIYDLGPNIPKFEVSQLPRHTYELVYLLGIHSGKFTPKDEIIRQKFSQLFVNFINSGNPTTEEDTWDRFNVTLNNYFRVDFDKDNKMPGMTLGYHDREVDFWTHTMEKDGQGREDVLDEALVYVPDIYIKHGWIPEEAKENWPVFEPIFGPIGKQIPAKADKPTNWKSFFEIVVLLSVVLAVVAICACGMCCFNWCKRRQYERFA